MSVTGIPGLQARLRAVGNTRGLLKTVQLRTVKEAKDRVPRKTGELGRSIVPGRLGPSSAEVVAHKVYAAPVEFGSRPHVIEPKRAKVLAWGGERRLSGRLRSGSAPTHFARRVHHPGNRPKPYLVPGAKAAAEREGVPFFIHAWNEAD
jgi:hypothetical protein